MENQNTQQPTQPVQPVVPGTPLSAFPAPAKPISATPEPPKPQPLKVTDRLKDLYTNNKDKKVFKLLVILFGILLLIIVVGSIYSVVKNLGGKQAVSVTPTPQPTPQIVLTEESKKSESALKILKDKIINLDIEQKHLTPPNIDFNISF